MEYDLSSPQAKECMKFLSAEYSMDISRIREILILGFSENQVNSDLRTFNISCKKSLDGVCGLFKSKSLHNFTKRFPFINGKFIYSDDNSTIFVKFTGFDRAPRYTSHMEWGWCIMRI